MATPPVTDPASRSDGPGLREHLRPILAWKWLIVTMVVVATAATYVLSERQEKEYTAKTRLYITGSGLEASLIGENGDTTIDDRDIANQAVLTTSRPVLQDAAAQLRPPLRPDQLRPAIKAEAQTGSDFISLSARARDAQLSADMVNAVAGSYIALRGRQVERAIDSAVTQARRELREARRSPSALLSVNDIRARLRSLELLQAIPPAPATQVEEALPPRTPSSPRPRLNAAFAFAMSLFLGVLLALTLERLDRRFRRLDDLELSFGVPLMGALPSARSPAPLRDGVPELNADLREGYRALRTNLELAALDHPVKSILVASAIADEGKSTVVRNLALAYAETGRRVVVVEADLRRPTVARMLGVEPDLRGLSSVLTEAVALEDALVEVLVDDPWDPAAATGRDGERGRISVLTTGAVAANPQSVLASRRMRSLMERLGEDHDVVLVDTSPLLAVSDAVPLLELVDGVLLVARLGTTTREAAGRLNKLLGLLPHAPVLGFVATDVPALERGSAWGYESYDHIAAPKPGRRGLRRRGGRAPAERPDLRTDAPAVQRTQW